MTRPRALSVLFALCLPTLAACTSEAERRREEVNEIAAAHAQLVEANERAEEAFARENPVPQRRDFGADGTLILHELELNGAPGREGLRIRYTWVNTTGRTIDAAVLRFTLHDPETGAEWSEDRVLRLPFALQFGADSSFSDEIRLLTGGLHRKPGWSWDVSVRVLE